MTARGFTLIEVLVALAIVAIALAAGMQATASLTNNALRQSSQMLAQLCAENELARVRLAVRAAGQFPGVGDTRLNCRQGQSVYEVALAVRPTPNPNFRRVDAQVFDGAQPLLRISTVVGRY